MESLESPVSAATSPSDLADPTVRSRLANWLSACGLGSGNLRVERLSGGQSNPSWRLWSDKASWVLRAKPAPAAQLLPSAHAIEREYRLLSALQGSAVPVPKVHALCEDETVIGVAFYLMDFVPGRIFRDANMPELSAAEREACYASANRTLAALHSIDWRALGLADFGRHEGYYTRLIHRWTQQYQASCAEPVPAMEQLAQWLLANIPAGADSADRTGITHGDYRIENLMFHPERPEVVAVLDWELATLGDPMSDLAYSALAWHMPSGILRGYADALLPGMPSEAAWREAYCGRRGLDAQAVARDWPFYLAFNLFRLAAILFGIGQRAREGVASNSTADVIAAMAKPVASWGRAIAQGRIPEQRGATEAPGFSISPTRRQT